ncbi:MAG: hypothetical protein ABIJ26_00140 [Candidatus Margulisiibacteriota bacterium]|nr:hypothetical protein [Candidatus Margulisiibacteriota bacterium]
MIGRVGGAKPRSYSVKDLYKVAMEEMKKEVKTMANRPLSDSEQQKLEELAKVLSNEVLDEMGIG